MAANCAICQGDGWLRRDAAVDDPQFGRLVRCSCMAAVDTAKVQALTGLQPWERKIRLKDINASAGRSTREMVQAATAFIANPRGILTIHGSSGNAKTHCLMAVVNELVERGTAAVYITAFDLLAHIRAAYHEDDDDSRRLAQLAEVSVLAVDEIDKIKPTEWAQEKLTYLLDRRYRSGLAGTSGTLVAMNQAPEQGVADWIASRLRDGRNRVVHQADGDMRPLMEGG